MSTNIRTAAVALVAVPLIAFAASTASAQQLTVSAAATGLGENYTAAARGFNAPAWNPAGLGMPGTPGFSVGWGGRTGLGMAPMSFSDVFTFDAVPDDVRSSWLATIRARGEMRVHGEADVTYIAFSAGRFAFQVASQVHGVGELSPEAAEVILFGDEGETGATREMTFDGTHFLTTMVTTTAASYAHPLAIRIGRQPEQRFAVGGTLRYIAGHGMAMGRDRSSRVTVEPFEATFDFPVVTSHQRLEDVGGAGSGVGIDLGASWQGGPYVIGASVRNVANSFKWNVDDFYWRAGRATYGADSSYQDFDSTRTMADAPADVRAGVTNLHYAPVVALGGLWTVSQRTRVVADLRKRMADGGMYVGESWHVGAGVERRVAPVLPLRLGGSVAGGALRLTAGVGLEIGPANFALSMARRMTGGTEQVTAVTGSIGTR